MENVPSERIPPARRARANMRKCLVGFRWGGLHDERMVNAGYRNIARRGLSATVTYGFARTVSFSLADAIVG